MYIYWLSFRILYPTTVTGRWPWKKCGCGTDAIKNMYLLQLMQLNNMMWSNVAARIQNMWLLQLMQLRKMWLLQKKSDAARAWIKDAGRMNHLKLGCCN